jgi:hypothetical protein
MNARRRRPNLGPQHAVAKRQNMGGARSASLKEARRAKMRAILIAAFVGLGIGLVGLSPSLAAPASGAAIAQAAQLNQPAEQVYWRRYHHRHWWWRHHWRHRWW